MVNGIRREDITSIDFRNVQGMKATEDERLKRVSQEFESVFVAQMLNIMDKTIERTGFISGGQAEEKFRSMLNQYIAQDIAKSPTGSIGIAKQMYEQMKRSI